MNQPVTSTAVSLATVTTRLLLPAWIGGALLFVVTSVAEQKFPGFDSAIRDQLAAIRFPWYYLYCWLTLGAAAASACIAAFLLPAATRRNTVLVASLTSLSLLIAIADYTFTYQPLIRLITPPGQKRTDDFTTLHNRSRIVNQVHLTIAMAAVIAASLPQTTTRQTQHAAHK